MCGRHIGNAHAENQRADESPEDRGSVQGGPVGLAKRCEDPARPSIYTLV
jgi:hypothetical protein